MTSFSGFLDQIAADKARFQPQNAHKPTQNNFEALRVNGQINVDRLMLIIPVGADDEWESLPNRSQRGFKFGWMDGTNQWEVWGHEPDLGAALGHAGGHGWTVRIKCGNKYLMNQTIHPPQGNQYDWAVCNTDAKIAASHIALLV